MSTLITSTAQIGTIKDAGGNHTAMTIDSSGRIASPQTPCFFAYMSGGSYYPDTTTSTPTPLNTTLVNIQNCWDTTNYKFIAPIAGTYQINWGITFLDNDNARYVASRIYKNNSQVGGMHRQYQPTAQGGNQYGGIDHSILLTFNASETFYVIPQCSDTLTVVAEYGTYMSGHLIG
tara:strand:- start:349 stop:876 length:528 start_codon:yes stop_codon:yes gene_type:complete